MACSNHRLSPLRAGALRGRTVQSRRLTVLFLYAALLLCACHHTLALAGVSATAGRPHHTKAQPSDVLTHVTFASCNRQHDDQSFWMRSIAPVIAKQRGTAAVAEAHTDLLLWLGNAVYADVEETGVARRRARPIEGIAAEYSALTSNNYYRQFVEQVVEAQGGRVAGIWDDRDLGLRFADGNYTQSEAVRRLYLTQLWKGFPLSIKDAAGEGVHGALYSFTTVPAPAGSPLADHFVNSVCTLTLDVRTQRTALPNLADLLLRSTAEDGLKMHGTHGRRLEEKLAEVRAARARVMQADLLGPAQWAWLEHTLSTYLAASKASPDDKDAAVGRAHCAVTLIASPLQILLNDNKPFEGWDLYPASRSRLLLLLKKYAVERVVFLSGHAEQGELGVVRRAAKADVTFDGPTASLINSFPMRPLTKAAASLLPPLPSYLVELTTGGLTHTVQEAPVVGRFTSWFTTARTSEDQRDNGFVKRYLFLTRSVTAQRNFGTLQIVGEKALRTPENGATASLSRNEVLAKTRVILSLHSVYDGVDATAPLLVFEKQLGSLPSYAVTPIPEEYNEEEEESVAQLDLHDVVHLPAFSTFNTPGEIPWLKRRLAERQCAEVPCVNGQHFMLLRTMGTLALAFVVLMVFLLAFYCFQLRNPQLFGEDSLKLKQD